MRMNGLENLTLIRQIEGKENKRKQVKQLTIVYEWTAKRDGKVQTLPRATKSLTFWRTINGHILVLKRRILLLKYKLS